ncbi:MAG: hypothetical protein KKC80_02510 [Candidatus Margulisbacteria bacterium]|nr:hypothetical protein [Candidatus Margulisiibacteriota bacterium]MBU1616774.1 hypothetical protein [Candidatus Margulisiibacteriota bacterium]
MKRFLIYLVLLLSFPFFGCGQFNASPSTGPIFTDPTVKLAELSSQNFTVKLFYEAIALEPLVNQTGTRVSFGFWSRSPNRDNLIVLLDQINSYASTEIYRAIWDEGTTTSTARQYTSYQTMNQEYWYERAYPLSDGTVSIEGVHYTDPHPVTTIEADLIWGAYSQRYVDMVKLVRQATGVTIESWCFVQGARAHRIFYSYELPKLASLEAVGDVRVHFAITSGASWQDPRQWITGTTNAPTPEP